VLVVAGPFVPCTVQNTKTFDLVDGGVPVTVTITLVPAVRWTLDGPLSVEP
jgi:hypothetical protein